MPDKETSHGLWWATWNRSSLQFFHTNNWVVFSIARVSCITWYNHYLFFFGWKHVSASYHMTAPTSPKRIPTKVEGAEMTLAPPSQSMLCKSHTVPHYSTSTSTNISLTNTWKLSQPVPWIRGCNENKPLHPNFANCTFSKALHWLKLWWTEVWLH